MSSLLGILIVLAAVAGGYLLANGEFALLYQPAEYVIIWGAALGSLVISTPPKVLKRLGLDVGRVFQRRRYSRTRYLETLQLFYALFQLARRGGMIELENEVERPADSKIFQEHPEMLGDKGALAFVCDTLRLAITGGATAYDLDQMADADLEVRQEYDEGPVRSLGAIADALPGLGIVAAVLGIVVAMSALNGPPAELGRKVAAALVGTFLGVLTCYGLVSPLTAAMANLHAAELAYFRTLKSGLIAFIKGHPPLLAVEFARRTIPHGERPTFEEMETACRNRRE